MKDEFMRPESRRTANFPNTAISSGWGYPYEEANSIRIFTALGDVDGDGDLDVVIASNASIAWYETVDKATPRHHLPRCRRHVIAEALGEVVSLSVGDVDRDGDEDVTVETEFTVVWYENVNQRGFFIYHDTTSLPECEEDDTVIDKHSQSRCDPKLAPDPMPLTIAVRLGPLRELSTTYCSGGCYGAYTPDFNCFGYEACGYSCVGDNCAYDGGVGCLCDCSICSNFFPGRCLDPQTGTCVASYVPTPSPSQSATRTPSVSPSISRTLTRTPTPIQPLTRSPTPSPSVFQAHVGSNSSSPSWSPSMSPPPFVSGTPSPYISASPTPSVSPLDPGVASRTQTPNPSHPPVPTSSPSALQAHVGSNSSSPTWTPSMSPPPFVSGTPSPYIPDSSTPSAVTLDPRVTTRTPSTSETQTPSMSHSWKSPVTVSRLPSGSSTPSSVPSTSLSVAYHFTPSSLSQPLSHSASPTFSPNPSEEASATWTPSPTTGLYVGFPLDIENSLPCNLFNCVTIDPHPSTDFSPSTVQQIVVPPNSTCLWRVLSITEPMHVICSRVSFEQSSPADSCQSPRTNATCVRAIVLPPPIRELTLGNGGLQIFSPYENATISATSATGGNNGFLVLLNGNETIGFPPLAEPRSLCNSSWREFPSVTLEQISVRNMSLASNTENSTVRQGKKRIYLEQATYLHTNSGRLAVLQSSSNLTFPRPLLGFNVPPYTQLRRLCANFALECTIQLSWVVEYRVKLNWGSKPIEHPRYLHSAMYPGGRIGNWTRAIIPERKLHQQTERHLVWHQSCPPNCIGRESGGLVAVSVRCRGFTTGPACLDWDTAHSQNCGFGYGGECNRCPENAACPGGARAWPGPGFWTANEAAGILYMCLPPSSERCKGWSIARGKVRCGSGYDPESPLCSGCARGYMQRGLQCVPCPKPSSSSGFSITTTLILALTTLLLFLLLFFLVLTCIMHRTFKISRLPVSRCLAPRISAEAIVWLLGTLQIFLQIARTPTHGLPQELYDFISGVQALESDITALVPYECVNGSPFSYALVIEVTCLVALCTMLGVSILEGAPLRKAERNRPGMKRLFGWLQFLASMVVLLLYGPLLPKAWLTVDCRTVSMATETTQGSIEMKPALVWSKDSRIICYEGDHLLPGLLSWIALVLVGLGLPVALTVLTCRSLRRKPQATASSVDETKYSCWRLEEKVHSRFRAERGLAAVYGFGQPYLRPATLWLSCITSLVSFSMQPNTLPVLRCAVLCGILLPVCFLHCMPPHLVPMDHRFSGWKRQPRGLSYVLSVLMVLLQSAIEWGDGPRSTLVASLAWAVIVITVSLPLVVLASLLAWLSRLASAKVIRDVLCGCCLPKPHWKTAQVLSSRPRWRQPLQFLDFVGSFESEAAVHDLQLTQARKDIASAMELPNKEPIRASNIFTLTKSERYMPVIEGVTVHSAAKEASALEAQGKGSPVLKLAARPHAFYRENPLLKLQKPQRSLPTDQGNSIQYNPLFQALSSPAQQKPEVPQCFSQGQSPEQYAPTGEAEETSDNDEEPPEVLTEDSPISSIDGGEISKGTADHSQQEATRKLQYRIFRRNHNRIFSRTPDGLEIFNRLTRSQRGLARTGKLVRARTKEYAMNLAQSHRARKSETGGSNHAPQRFWHYATP